MQRKVFQFKELSLQHHTTGAAATAQLYTDATPGADLAAQLGGGKSLGTSTGPVTVTIPLDGIEGTSYRLEVTPAAGGVTRLLAGQVLVRPYGVYLVGALGEKFVTQNIAIGI